MQTLARISLLRASLVSCLGPTENRLVQLVSHQLESLSVSKNESRRQGHMNQLPYSIRNFGTSRALCLDQSISTSGYANHNIPLALDDDSDDDEAEQYDQLDMDTIDENPLTATKKRSRKASGPPADQMQKWISTFQTRIVDVNRSAKGSPVGSVGRFCALVVCGNGDGVLGFGQGKSAAMGAAIKKANRQALKTLFFVPRYNDATIRVPIKTKFGKSKVTMYPKSSGSGCKASDLMTDICHLAGIKDIGIKIHGSRNLRNQVKAVIRGLEGQRVEEEEEVFPATTEKNTYLHYQHRRMKKVHTQQTIGLLSIPRTSDSH